MKKAETYQNLFDQNGDLTRESALRYTFNSMPAEEKALVEQHLATCEMCADMVEGYRNYPNYKAAELAIHRLEGRMQASRRKGAAVVPMRRQYFAAAAIIAMLIGGAVWFSTLLLPDRQELAETKQMEPKQKDEQNVEEEAPVEEADADSETITPPEVTTEQAPTQTTSRNATAQDDGAADMPAEPEENATTAFSATALADDETDMDNHANLDQSIQGDTPQEELKTTDAGFDYAAADTYRQEAESSKQSRQRAATAPSAKSQPALMGGAAPGANQESASMNALIAPVVAEYPGGEEALNRYLNTFQPSAGWPAATKNQENPTSAELWLTAEGMVRKLQVLPSVDAKTDAEIASFLKKMPAWQVLDTTLPDNQRKVVVVFPRR